MGQGQIDDDDDVGLPNKKSYFKNIFNVKNCHYRLICDYFCYKIKNLTLPAEQNTSHY